MTLVDGASPLVFLIPLSLLAGLALFVVAILRWRSSWKVGLSCLLGAVFLQLWWSVPFVWWISPNLRIYNEVHIR